MSKDQVYLSNHGRAMRFPWSLYHLPLIRSLHHFLSSVKNPAGKKILVIGPGDLQELSLLKDLAFEVSILDIDQRVLDKLRKEYPESIRNSYLVDDNFMGYPDPESFDVIYAKEVIEHLPVPEHFVRKVRDILRPHGVVWMSTPNYGFFLLPFLEKTILEVIARLSGFSRRDIHPSRFDREKLERIFSDNGFEVQNVEVTFAGLALSVSAIRRDLNSKN